MKCPICKKKFGFKERLDLTYVGNNRIVCNNCNGKFEKERKFILIDIVIGLVLNIIVMVSLINFINGIYNNLYLSVLVGIILGQATNFTYLLLIQNFRKLKKI